MILGLTGFKGSGKSAVADALLDRGFIRLRMAGILKDMLRVLGLTDAQIDGAEKESPCELLGGKTPRWAMQSLGTEWGRVLIVPDLWTRAMRHRLRAQQIGASVVIDDIRFPNEAALIREFDGAVWRVTRPGCAGDGHVSESHIATLPVDYELANAGTLEDLRRAVHARLALRPDHGNRLDVA